MKQAPTVGPNLTGRGAAPERADEMRAGMDRFPPTSNGDGEAAGRMREEYASSGVRTGSIPETGKEGGMADPELAPLLDKLGARLAFERAGTRLYDALISKHEAYGSFEKGPSVADLETVRGEEYEHFLLLHSAIEELGGDPTALTPSANLQLVASQGIPAAVTDPRTSLLESLEAVLVAELADGESWAALIELAEAHGQDRFAAQFRTALETEHEHLRKVRGWVTAGTLA